jgi:hypothetical protein
MGRRDVEIDIIGNDRTGRATRSAERNLKSLNDRATGAAQAAGRLAAGVARLATAASVAASAIVPLATGAAATAVAVGRAAAAMAPMLGALPALAAGAVLAKVAMLAIGPAVVAAVKPIAVAWEGVSARVGAVASKGLPELARAFVRLDLPVVERDLKRVAAAVNAVALGYGRWVTSAEGVAAVSEVTARVAATAGLAAPHVDRIAVSLSRLAARGADPAFGRLAPLIGRIADAVVRWADGISAADIAGGMDRAGAAARTFASRMAAVRDVVVWLADHQDQMRAASDALGLIGLAIGAVTGNAAMAGLGAFTLLANHLDTIKIKAGELAGWWSSIWQRINSDPSVAAIRSTLGNLATLIKGDLADAWAGLQVSLRAVATWAQAAWEKLGPKLDEALNNPNVQLGIRTMVQLILQLTVGLAALAVAAGVVAAGIAVAFGLMIAWFTGVFAPAWFGLQARFGHGLAVLLNAAALTAEALGMSELAGKLRTAQRSVEKFVDETNATLAKLRDKTITIKVNAWVNGNLAQIERVAGNANDREGRGARFSSFRGGVEFAAPGGGRATPPVPIVNATTTVLLDGQVIRSIARTEVEHGIDRQAWRARAGRR